MFNDSNAVVAVREDLAAAHREVWLRLARAGTWWSGVERVAIAAETRRARSCELCVRRKESVSPSLVEGGHAATTNLSRAAVEAVHRIVTDPGRLTKAWYETLLAEGLSDAQYVELIGVVIGVLAVDTVSFALGAEPALLPEPEAGEPTRERPPQARLDGAWLPMIARGEDTGLAAGLYGDARMVPNVMRALSLVPAETRAQKRLGEVQYLPYGEVANAKRGNDLRALSRMQMELIAARVSKFNECFY